MTGAVVNTVWFEITRPGPHWNTLPKWWRTVGLADDGTVYVPSILASEKETWVMLLASYDGTSCAVRDGHAFFPTSWVAENFPKVRRMCATAERQARAAHPAALA